MRSPTIIIRCTDHDSKSSSSVRSFNRARYRVPVPLYYYLMLNILSFYNVTYLAAAFYNNCTQKVDSFVITSVFI